jgi:hypothetical protein
MIALNIEEAIPELLQDGKLLPQIVPEGIDGDVKDMKAVAVAGITKSSLEKERRHRVRC